MPTIAQIAEREIKPFVQNFHFCPALSCEWQSIQLDDDEQPIGIYRNQLSDGLKDIFFSSKAVYLPNGPTSRPVWYEQIESVDFTDDKKHIMNTPSCRTLRLALKTAENVVLPITGQSGSVLDIYSLHKFFKKTIFFTTRLAAPHLAKND